MVEFNYENYYTFGAFLGPNKTPEGADMTSFYK